MLPYAGRLGCETVIQLSESKKCCKLFLETKNLCSMLEHLSKLSHERINPLCSPCSANRLFDVISSLPFKHFCWFFFFLFIWVLEFVERSLQRLRQLLRLEKSMAAISHKHFVQLLNNMVHFSGNRPNINVWNTLLLQSMARRSTAGEDFSFLTHYHPPLKYQVIRGFLCLVISNYMAPRLSQPSYSLYVL